MLSFLLLIRAWHQPAQKKTPCSTLSLLYLELMANAMLRCRATHEPHRLSYLPQDSQSSVMSPYCLREMSCQAPRPSKAVFFVLWYDRKYDVMLMIWMIGMRWIPRVWSTGIRQNLKYRDAYLYRIVIRHPCLLPGDCEASETRFECSLTGQCQPSFIRVLK